MMKDHVSLYPGVMGTDEWFQRNGGLCPIFMLERPFR